MKKIRREIIIDNHTTTKYLGIVVDNKDEKKEGRCRVRVFGKFDNIEDNMLPWAICKNKNSRGSLIIPKIGDIVVVEFNNGNIYEPEYYAIEYIEEELKEKWGDYPDSFSLVYDIDNKIYIYFNKSNRLIIKYNNCELNIDSKDTLHIKNNKNEIHIDGEGNIDIKSNGEIKVDCNNIVVKSNKEIFFDCNTVGGIKLGSNAIKSIIMGEDFMSIFNSHTHIGNLGYPTGPPVPLMTNAQFSNIIKIM